MKRFHLVFESRNQGERTILTIISLPIKRSQAVTGPRFPNLTAPSTRVLNGVGRPLRRAWGDWESHTWICTMHTELTRSLLLRRLYKLWLSSRRKYSFISFRLSLSLNSDSQIPSQALDFVPY
jgi:hypothetical protein